MLQQILHRMAIVWSNPMQKIVVESALGERLGELDAQAVLCDSSGRALGVFSPIGESQPLPQLQLEPPLSIAQTEELRKVRTGKPLEEVLARLGMDS
jgi:hypothetical protein